jgi:(1->4)-alpha-D-glucan 1-alpha-D-glucosylmutase
MTEFVSGIAACGWLNSLARTLIKICSPGVPDFYQGTEFWDFSLVDPDNRRPVDFDRRRRALEELESSVQGGLQAVCDKLLDAWPDDRIKLFVTWRSLALRREQPELFLQGDYAGLSVAGPAADHAIGLARHYQEKWLVAAAPLFVKSLSDRLAAASPLEAVRQGYRQTSLALPEGAPNIWRHALTGQEVRAAASDGGAVLPLDVLFEHFPVALLYAEGVKP